MSGGDEGSELGESSGTVGTGKAESGFDSFGNGEGLSGTVTAEQLLDLYASVGDAGFGGVQDGDASGSGGSGYGGFRAADDDGGSFGSGGIGGSAAAEIAVSAAAAIASPIAPREPFDNPKDGLRYTWIPPGSFQMGCVPQDSGCSQAEKPRHGVRFRIGFWMSRTEVTVRVFRAYAKANGLPLTAAPAFSKNWKHVDHPRVRVPWQGAVEFCSWTGGRLPTEAEWEYIARGGDEGEVYPAGDMLRRDDANFADNGEGEKWEYTSPVGFLPANGFDLLDMAGNGWEWTPDEYRADAYASPSNTESESAAVQTRVMRGGSMYSERSSLRVSYRGRSNPGNRLFYVGFRCVRDAAP